MGGSYNLESSLDWQPEENLMQAMHRLMLQNRRPRTLEEWGFKGTDGTRGRYRMINELATNKIIERTHERRERCTDDDYD